MDVGDRERQTALEEAEILSAARNTMPQTGWKEWTELGVSFWQPRRNWIASLLILLATSAMAVALKPVLAGEVSSGLIFVLGITLVGATSGLIPAIICALFASAFFNFFLAEPVLTFRMTTGEDLAPPIIFTLCATVSGVLSGRLKDQSLRVQSSNFRLESLLEASRNLQRAATEVEVYDALKSVVPARLGIEFVLFRQHAGTPVIIGDGRADPPWMQVAERILAESTEFVHENGLSGYRLSGSGGVAGVLVSDEIEDASPGRNFMLALAQIIGLALERSQLAARVAEVQALARTEELKSALLSSVSHDLRTPLTAISTSASSLLSFGDRFDKATSHQLLEGIVEECDRLNHLTANLLEMTRLQGGTANMRRSILPAAEITRNAIARQRRFAADRQISFIAPREEIFIEADTALFELALANVLQNAIQYSTAPEEVSVVCEKVDGHCRIVISDDGIGIPRKEQLRVFERFYRVERNGSAPKGTGLGLAIAKGFVEASNGTIAIQSPVRDGHGTTVTIRLPLAALRDVI